MNLSLSDCRSASHGSSASFECCFFLILIWVPKFLIGISFIILNLIVKVSEWAFSSSFLFRYAAPRSRSERTNKWAVMMLEFAPICIYLVISLLVSLILLGLPFLFASNSSTYPEKLSAYECGFDPFGDARSRFDIRFYLVSILFIIFDLEVTFFFSLGSISQQD